MLGIAPGPASSVVALLILYAVLFGGLGVSLVLSRSWRARWIVFMRRRGVGAALGAIPTFAASIFGARLVDTSRTVIEYLAWYGSLFLTLTIPIAITLRWVRRTAPAEWARSLEGENYSPEFQRRFRRFFFKSLAPWVALVLVATFLLQRGT
jgi:hypothetical protein